jgi:hypothetical protein
MPVMAEGLVFALYLALLMSMVVAFFWMAFNIAAIRRMLENAGLFSDTGCPHCRFPVPKGAEICGHCGRELTRADAP